MDLLTEVKSTKFSFDDSQYMDGVIKKVNDNRDKKKSKVTLSNIMRESTLNAIKKLEKEIEKGS